MNVSKSCKSYLKINGIKKIVSLRVHNMLKKYVAHIRNIKQALKYGLRLKKVHKAIAFYQEACLKPYIEMNTDYEKCKKA